MGFGGLAAGMSLYLDKGIPVFTYNYFDDYTTLRGSEPIDGEAEILVDFASEGGEKPGAGGTVTLSVDGTQVAQETMAATVPGRFGADTFGVGEDSGQPVTTDYEVPFAFTGTIEKVVIDIR
jgi:arylsulfatase